MNTSNESPELKTIDLVEAAKFLGFQGTYHLRKKAKDGIVPGFKAGRNWMFYVPDLIDYIRSICPKNLDDGSVGENKAWQLAKRKAATTTIHASRSAESECKNLREQLRKAKRKNMKKSEDGT